MKGPSTTTRNQDLVVNCTPMVIYILESILKTKSMEKAHFIGLAYAQINHYQNLKSSNIMEHGGEVYLMAKDSISNRMVLST